MMERRGIIFLMRGGGERDLRSIAFLKFEQGFHSNILYVLALLSITEPNGFHGPVQRPIEPQINRN
jgi:hypothetical protein